ncbi:4Fe-4S dicluster domain-containing protein [Clostridium fermenticellae]|uniref:4Fe-4S dicluster domain-containing protein n=1 Tax=Clostridium fermenticellae TaxID=2068654 RepID=A0A386H2V4_9CLOT|nr:[FeFe] hydrogenase, group A [Clostridium fermenticellae]AYD39873.1 4Fe-4S dicluster domain-containing protein [Clostridium fermenticellae]
MSNASIINIDRELCTGCRRCAEVCPVDAIEGEDEKPQSIDTDKCVMCGQCVQICKGYLASDDEVSTPRSKKLFDRGMLNSVREPIFAAYNLGQVKKLKEMLRNKDMFKVVQCAPSVRVALGEDFGLPLGTLTPGKMAASLKKLGFDRVYDTNFGADLTIMEEGSELIQRLKDNENLPMFTSCCPAWVKYLEQMYPELLNHLSSCKSPQQMAGVVFKTYGAKINGINPGKIYSVSIMPCTCKEFECERDEMHDSGYRDVDLVITTRELAQLLKDEGIDFYQLQEEKFDTPLGKYSGAGAIFGSTGGVMEAALRTGYELATKKTIPKLDLTMVRGGEGFRTAEIELEDFHLKVGVVSGLKNVKTVLESIKSGKCDLQFIEVMTCPEGCISGGGQPKLFIDSDRDQAYKNRKKSIYQHDANLSVRKSHENPAIKEIYNKFLKKPLGEKSHELLHTQFISRRK